MEYKRPVFEVAKARVTEARRFIQVLSGPRQSGKTTIAHQIMESLGIPCHYATGDQPLLKAGTWIEQQWEVARLKLKETNKTVLLILDEIQKIHGWSEAVKRLWDEDFAGRRKLLVMILGSSPLLMERGLSESLAGRFEIIPVTHWSFNEMNEAFGWDLERFIFYGGYPGSVLLVADPQRWANYINESLIETTLSRDILLMKRVDKPALLRRLFELCAGYSAQVLSYQKMLVQLQDAGNTTTLAHYLQLLGSAGLVMGLAKYSGARVRQRASSPKLLVLNTALMTTQSGLSLEETRKNRELWGRLVKPAVGAHLANATRGTAIKLYYWLDRNREVDFVLERGEKLVAIEVKSGRERVNLPGTLEFSRIYPRSKKLLVGSGGIPIERFFRAPVGSWVE